MRTVKTLRPGQKGTKELLKRFGSNLLLVRYRYDEQRREQVKTVEMVVRRRSRKREAEVEGSWSPGARVPGARGAVGGRAAVWIPAGSAADRLAGEGPAAAGEVGWRPMGSGHAGVDSAAGGGGAAGLAGTDGRWERRYLNMGSGGGEEVPRLPSRCSANPLVATTDPLHRPGGVGCRASTPPWKVTTSDR